MMRDRERGRERGRERDTEIASATAVVMENEFFD